MNATDLKGIARAVVRRAQHQGYIVPRDIRRELTHAGAADSMWKDVLALARSSLSYRKGRYYYAPSASDRARQQRDQQRLIEQAVDQLIQQHQKETTQVERRGQNRTDFIQIVKAQTEDHRSLTLLSRDLSSSGIRLIGTRSLLGQKVRIQVPSLDVTPPWCFVVRVLWTCAVGDDLFENGGTFVDIESGPLPELN